MLKLFRVLIAALFFVSSGLANATSVTLTGAGKQAAASGIAVTALGTNSVASGVTVTLTGITVPAGALIAIVTYDNAGPAGGSVSDGGVNSYTTLYSLNSGSQGNASFFYVCNATALTGATLTFTKANAGSAGGMSAFYATGIATVSCNDGAVSANTSVTTTTPSITSGTPAQSGELFIGVVHVHATTTFTQDSGNGWSNINPFFFNASGAGLGDGQQINAGTGTKTFAPVFGTSVQSYISISGFKHP